MLASDGTQNGGVCLLGHPHGVVRGGSNTRLLALLSTGNHCIHLTEVVGWETNHGQHTGSPSVGTKKFRLVHFVIGMWEKVAPGYPDIAWPLVYRHVKPPHVHRLRMESECWKPL